MFKYVFVIVLSVPCSLVIIYWERDVLLALLCVMYSCVFVTFPYGVPSHEWYLIVSIPDLCLLRSLLCKEFYSFFATSLIILDSIYPTTLNYFEITIFGVNELIFCHI